MSQHFLTAKIFSDKVVLTDAKGANEKQISPQDFVATLGKHIASEVSGPKSTQRLPHGTIFVERTLNETFVAIYYQGGEHTYRLNIGGKETTHKIIRPNIVLEAKLSNGNSHGLLGYYFYCTPTEAEVMAHRYHKGFKQMTRNYPDASHRQGIHLVPFTNMYDNGTMCLGGNSVPSVYPPDDLSGLNRYFDILANSPGNSDLPIRGLSGALAAHSGAHTTFFRKLSELKAFPYDQLFNLAGN